ncbi:type II secretion system F family protein [Roseitranquillus sediminis]|uniref:type II secretion system F family protein n=1 Tax=Roseitranquillus sediminis TaxID=2809051 RepID=UPI001D0C1629|nr:type II secretion system F family protein [Roseitranquillus sediminis]MBM9594750.1 type II secretion system F family protein [Roseitranquillus sediminis]
MTKLDPALIPFLIAGLVVVAVSAAIWSIFSGHAAERERRYRRLQCHAPSVSIDRRRVGNAEDEVLRNASAMVRRRRTGKGLSFRFALQQAGLLWPVWMVPVVVAILALSLGSGARLAGLSQIAAGLFGLATGPGLFLIFLRVRRARRKKAMEKDFPNALDIIVRGVKSGLPLNDCLRIVSREVPDPLGSEFARMVEQQGHGVPIAEAVDRLADRVPLTEANFFAIVIGLQTKTGGRLAESLDNLVSVLRARVQLRAKIGSMSSEAKASGAIIAALPVVVATLVYITSPAYISLLFTEAIGNVVLVASAIWMLIGVFVMRKMIAFDY